MENPEIGGFIEFERYKGHMFHEQAIKLNCGRSGLEYILKAQKIREIYLPYYNCYVIADTCKKYGVKIKYYHIGNDFKPILEGIIGKFVYVINYFGQLSNTYLKKLSKTNHIIVDNAQAYFQRPIKGVDTIYSCRKFIGVSDGGILYTTKPLNEKLEKDFSYNRMQFLFGRLEKTASEFYKQNQQNNQRFDSDKLKLMSDSTENILKSLNYKIIRNQRNKNFKFLFNSLKLVNKLKIIKTKGAYAYPLLIENGCDLRQKLINKKVYIPTLWPNVLEEVDENTLEYDFSKNILPLPCDQRYTKMEMVYIINLIKEYSNECEN